MSALELLHNRIDLSTIPFTDRGSRLLIFREGNRVAIRLAERWERWQSEVGHYRQRPPILDQLTFLNDDGVPQPFEVNSYPYCVTLHTPLGNFAWTFIEPEAVLVRLPAGSYGITFEAHGTRGATDRRGGTLHGKRNIAYTTNAQIVENQMFVLTGERFRINLRLSAREGDALLLNVTPRLGYNRSLPPPDEAIAASRAAWQAWFAAVPSVLPEYERQYAYAWWIMRAGLLNTRYYFTREALVPSKIHYVGVWQWDQYFHALAYRHVDARLAEDQIRIVLDHQREDGMLPDAIHDEGLVTHLTRPVDADVTKPPLTAWAALKVFEKCGRLDFLSEVYEPITHWHNWWLRHNLSENGLCHYQHPFSSGLDDSPLWDDGVPVVAPDLNTYIVVQAESLARMADLLGIAADAARYREQAQQHTARMLEKLWDEQCGYFHALYQGRPVQVFTPFQLLPLWTGALPERVNARLIDHLTNPQTFWGRWKLATVALTDPKFDPDQMWRGPVWANINYLFIEALKRVGRPELADALRRNTLELIMHSRDIYEYYNPLTGARPPKAAPIFGWTSAVFIDLAIQQTAHAQHSG
ncbi:MAG: trehalase family glycosidase [Anaerolineae bacterium]|nr:trehalase family glycosidase [Anaerolineae bacterium]MDW8297955.1 trehalase family glycosidase [Anaerolineae bacterium]